MNKPLLILKENYLNPLSTILCGIMGLSPREIYQNVQNGNVDKSSAVELLVSLSENSRSLNTRLKSISMLEKVGARTEPVFKLLENLFISDGNERVRNIAAKALKSLFLDKALTPMKWAIEHEPSLNCLITAISILGEINTNESKRVLIEELRQIGKEKLDKYLKHEQESLNELSGPQLSQILINHALISSLKLKFGYINFELKDGAIIKLDLSSVDKLGLGSTTLNKFLGSILSLNLLKQLDIKFNNLTNLPRIPFKVPSLRSLDLSFNRLLGLPESIKSFESLRVLNLKSNRIKQLPDSIRILSKL